jgi:hypothetical protein
MKNIGIALFINTSLFLGGLHQWLYVRLLEIERRNQKEVFAVLQEAVSMGTLQKTIYRI